MKRERKGKTWGEMMLCTINQQCINCPCPTQPQELSLQIKYISVNKNLLEWHCFSLCRFFFFSHGDSKLCCLPFFPLSTRYIIPFKCSCVFINRAKMSERGAPLGRLKVCTGAVNQRTNPFRKMLILRQVPFTFELFSSTPQT